MRLATLFGVIYFIQGIGEPGEGLIAQPVRSMLAGWGHSAAEIATFGAVLALPWVLKPVYGLLSDFLPIAGSHRRSYLLIASAATMTGFAWLYFNPPASGSYVLLLTVLLVPTIGIAVCDVAADALMVEKGQPRGLTGQLQSVQWACLYAAIILTGALGGWLAQHGRQDLGFLICAAASGAMFLLAMAFVREAPRHDRGVASVPQAVRVLWSAISKRSVWAAALFLLLWNFNPFTAAVLYLHMTRELGMSEQFYGNTISLLSIAAIAGSIVYGFFCRRFLFRNLIHAAIVAGILATAAYWGLEGKTSAILVALVAGFVYMIGNLVQLDLAARVSPVETAGTTFALLMAGANLGLALAAGLGGWLYDYWSVRYTPDLAFDLLVLAGALCTTACWLVVPLLKKGVGDK